MNLAVWVERNGRNLLMMSLSYFADIDPISPDDAVLHASPISHGSGLYGLPHVASGAVSVIPVAASTPTDTSPFATDPKT